MSDTASAEERVHHSATQARGERGRWVRTVKQQSARLQAAFVHTLTEEDVEAIARELIADARDGNHTAARLVLRYGLGDLMPQMATDWALESEPVERPAAAPSVATGPTAEELRAAMEASRAAQAALDAEILGKVRPQNPAPVNGQPGGRSPVLNR